MLQNWECVGGREVRWPAEMCRKAHDLWAESLPFVSLCFHILSIRDNLECVPPALETDGSEEAGWKKGIINIWRWVNVLALGSWACGFSQSAQMSPHLLCWVVLVTFLLRVSCTVWPRVRDVKTWGKSGAESTSRSGCDKADWQAGLWQGRQSCLGRAERVVESFFFNEKGYVFQFFGYSEDSLPPLPHCCAPLWTLAEWQLEIKHNLYLQYPPAPFFPGTWWAPQTLWFTIG